MTLTTIEQKLAQLEERISKLETKKTRNFISPELTQEEKNAIIMAIVELDETKHELSATDVLDLARIKWRGKAVLTSVVNYLEQELGFKRQNYGAKKFMINPADIEFEE